METDREEVTQARSISGINFILSIWLIISPWILNYSSSAAKWNQVIFGIVVLILSAVRYLVPAQSWASWLNGLAGLWMIIAPFILSYSRSVSYWNEIIVGAVIAILAFWNVGVYTQRHHHAGA